MTDEKLICYGGDGVGHEAHWCEDGTCSYCGSLHPDKYLEAMKRAVDPADPTYIDPTTKYYKWYAVTPEDGQKKFYSWHIPDDKEWLAEANRLNPHVTKISATKIERKVNGLMDEMTAKDRGKAQET